MSGRREGNYNYIEKKRKEEGKEKCVPRRTARKIRVKRRYRVALSGRREGSVDGRTAV